jgi:hypothetical protein
MQTAVNTEKLKNFIVQKFEADELNNESLVQIIELCGQYLNLQTISDYSRKNNLSYNGTKNFRTIINFFNVKFVIDNK